MKQGDRILEAMSGSGRLQIPLIERGFIVDGIDTSAAMLDRCRNRLAEKNLSAELFHDALETARIPYCYDVITIAVASFQLITDRAMALKALKNLRAHTKTGGHLLIDIFTPDTAADPRTMREARLDNATIIRQTIRHIFDEEQRIAEGYCTYELITHGAVQETEHEVITITWYTDEELRALLSQAGFTWITKYHETFRSSGPSYIVHAQAT